MTRRRAPLLVVAALAASGCVHERSRALGELPVGALGGATEASRPRAAAAPPTASVAGSATSAPGTVSAAVVSPAVAGGPGVLAREEGGAPPPPASGVSLPAGIPTRAAHRPLAAGASLADATREHFLSSPTTVVAESATAYLPEPFAAEASLRGVAVRDEAGGRRVAEGDAVLVVRALTVRAQRLTLVARAAGADVQVTAHGSVSFRSDQPASTVEESGLRSLLLRNDGYTPLR